MKQVNLKVFPPDESNSGEMSIGKADIQKTSDGKVQAVITISNMDLILQLGGNKFVGEITNYVLNDLEEPSGEENA